MTIEIDFEILKDTQMSADDYLYLYIVYRKGFNYLSSLNLKPNLEQLQRSGFIKLGESPDQHEIQQAFIDLFTSDFDQMFAELVGLYPVKVETSTGIRVLHAIDPEAKSNRRTKTLYSKVVNQKKATHNHIMTCLKKQLLVQKDNLGYLQNLTTWVSQHTWEQYENLSEDDTRATTRPRITRSL
jgi:hypothetical protein